MFVIGMAMSEGKLSPVGIRISHLSFNSLAVLTIRTWIIWNKDRRLAIGLMIFFFTVWGVGLYIMYQFVESLQCKWEGENGLNQTKACFYSL